MALSALPDADALLFGVIPYNHPFGHRGFTHSLFFAAIIGLLVSLLFSKAGWAPQHSFWWLTLVFAVATAMHGFLDAMTDGGLGVAVFAPFTNHWYFLPWRPIPVAPLSLEGLLNPRGFEFSVRKPDCSGLSRLERLSGIASLPGGCPWLGGAPSPAPSCGYSR